MFGTLHANSAAKTIDRIIDVFPTGDKEMVRAMLSSSLQGVIAQTLLRRSEGGRVGAFEILVGTNAVRNLIRENQIPQMYSMMQTGSRYGMNTMEDAIADLRDAGIIDKDEARKALLKATDESDEKDSDYADGALGGGKMSGDDDDEYYDGGSTSGGISSGGNDGEYSF